MENLNKIIKQNALCIWIYDKNWYLYDTECGHIFQFDEEHKPENYIYCPACGKQIKEAV